MNQLHKEMIKVSTKLAEWLPLLGVESTHILIESKGKLLVVRKSETWAGDRCLIWRDHPVKYIGPWFNSCDLDPMSVANVLDRCGVILNARFQFNGLSLHARSDIPKTLDYIKALNALGFMAYGREILIARLEGCKENSTARLVFIKHLRNGDIYKAKDWFDQNIYGTVTGCLTEKIIENCPHWNAPNSQREAAQTALRNGLKEKEG